MIMASSWNSRTEDYWFDKVEEFARNQLVVGPDLPDRWLSLPKQLCSLIASIEPPPPESFIVDAIATTIGLLIGTWEDYVRSYVRKLPPDILLSHLHSRPSLENFLTAFQWPTSILRTHHSLALSELEERLGRGEGATAEEYEQRFGIAIRQPAYRVQVTVQDLENSNFSPGNTFPLYGSLIVGRQRQHSREPEPVCFLKAEPHNRLVIAGKQQPDHCSREQLLICALTPQYIYVKNISSILPAKVMQPRGIEATHDSEPISELSLNPNQVDLLDCGQTAVRKVPFSIALPRKLLRFSG